MSASCGGCEAKWTATGWCHCSGCHNTFSSLTAFDKHRVRYACANPVDRGLANHDSVWRLPAPKPWGLLKKK